MPLFPNSSSVKVFFRLFTDVPTRACLERVSDTSTPTFDHLRSALLIHHPNPSFNAIMAPFSYVSESASYS